MQLGRCWEPVAGEADWSLWVWMSWSLNSEWGWPRVRVMQICHLLKPWVTSHAGSWTLVNILDCFWQLTLPLQSWETGVCSGSVIDEAVNDLHFGPNLRNTKQRTLVLDSCFIPPGNCKKGLTATSELWLLCSVSETYSCCFGGVAGQGAWYWHSNECTYQTPLWATEFLYLILPQ